MTGCLRLDIGVGPFTPPETLLGISSHLSNQRRSERDSFSLIELVKAGLQQGAKLGKLMLSLVEQSHRFADHGIHVGELTAGNLFPYPGFDVGGKSQCHRIALSGLAASAYITLQ